MNRNQQIGIHTEAVHTALGVVRVLWREDSGRPQAVRILLPREDDPNPDTRPRLSGEAVTPPAIAALCDKVRLCLAGELVVFDLDTLALEECPPFHRRALEAAYRIPRGQVTTYRGLALDAGVPAAARAAGNAMATNPFPIVIPCHRVVRSNGELGGFGGGLHMKRRLLEIEGIRFTLDGRVDPAQIV